MKKLFFLFILMILFCACSQESSNWEKAKALDDLTSYQSFLEKFPEGIFADSAKSKIYNIQMHEAWKSTKESGETISYLKYIEDYAESVFADSAKSKIESKQIAIYSIPEGLNIYMGKPTDAELNSDEKWVKIYDGFDKHKVFDQNNKVGTTPFNINDIDAGKYLLGVEPVEFMDVNMKWQCIDPFLKKVGYVSSFSIDYDNQSEILKKLKSGEIKQEGGIVYLIEKEEGKLNTVILLAQEMISLDEYDKYYPKEKNFIFDSIKLIQDIKSKNIQLSAVELHKSIDLLKRGGKIFLNRGAIRYTIEIIDHKRWNIEIMRKGN